MMMMMMRDFWVFWMKRDETYQRCQWHSDRSYDDGTCRTWIFTADKLMDYERPILLFNCFTQREPFSITIQTGCSQIK